MGGTIQTPISYKRHRFPLAIIAHAAWLYFHFLLRLHLVLEMLLERGIAVCYETVRRRAMKFGRDYARRLRRKKPGPCDIWHLDPKHWLWRAVDQDGYILNEIERRSGRRRCGKAGRGATLSGGRHGSLLGFEIGLTAPDAAALAALWLTREAEWLAAAAEIDAPPRLTAKAPIDAAIEVISP